MLGGTPPQILKKSRIVANRASKIRQTTYNWIKRVLDEATYQNSKYLSVTLGSKYLKF